MKLVDLIVEEIEHDLASFWVTVATISMVICGTIDIINVALRIVR